MQEHWITPDWWYLDKRPQSDNVYFENLSRIIFQAGLNWSVTNKKWPTIKKVFHEFSTKKISGFTQADVRRLMKDKGIIRHKAKITAVIQNAKEFEKIEKEYGSFQKYLDHMDKSNNYQPVIKELTTRFKRLGPSSASLFLYTVGEKIKHTW